MAWSKIDLIRINAYVVKVRNGMPLDEAPEKYRDAVSSAARQTGEGDSMGAYKACAHLDSGLFDEADIAEVEELAAAYYDALDRAEEPTKQEGGQ